MQRATLFSCTVTETEKFQLVTPCLPLGSEPRSTLILPDGPGSCLSCAWAVPQTQTKAKRSKRKFQRKR